LHATTGVSSETLAVYSNMKADNLKIGDIVKLKGSGIGLSKVIKITGENLKRGKKYELETLDGKYLLSSEGKYLEKLNPENESLVKALDSVGLI